jgi:hypothetical protein
LDDTETAKRYDEVMPDFSGLLDSRALVSVLSAVGGALFWNFVALYRGRVRVLEYTVTHERVGVSAEDAIFGNVAVTWQGQPVINLFVSTVMLENNTSSDYTALKFKVYTGSTFLLTERREIAGSTYLPVHTDEYMASVMVAAESVPTPLQQQIYWHSREYSVPVLNRGQRVVLTYLTTIPNATDSPAVWVDMLHSGVTLRFRPSLPQIHGVPIRMALPIGLVACLAVVVSVSLSAARTWVVAVICMVVGLIAQSIGAALYRIGKFIRQVIFR